MAFHGPSPIREGASMALHSAEDASRGSLIAQEASALTIMPLFTAWQPYNEIVREANVDGSSQDVACLWVDIY